MARSVAPFIRLNDHDIAFHWNELVRVIYPDLVKAQSQQHRSPILGVSGMGAIGAGSSCGQGEPDVLCALPSASVMRAIPKLGSESFDIDRHDSARDAILIEIPAS